MTFSSSGVSVTGATFVTEHRVTAATSWVTGGNTAGILVACQCGRMIIGTNSSIIERWDRHLRGDG